MRNVYLLSMVALIACGGGSTSFTGLKKPVDIALSTEEIAFSGVDTQFAYVVDAFTQSITVVDTYRENLVDTVADDDLDATWLTVGGEPVSIVVDNTSKPHRIFVADGLQKSLIAYQIEEPDADSSIVTFRPVSLGGDKEGRSSRPLFRDSGSASSPTLTNIVVDPDKAKNESWRAVYIDNGLYQVIGTESGIQENFAKEGEDFVSDDGEIRFFISGGGEQTTGDDIFYFTTAVFKPLVFDSTPVDMIIRNDHLYVLTKDDPSVVIVDLKTLLIEATYPFTDLSIVPNKMTLVGANLYISQVDSSNIQRFNTNTPGFTEINTGIEDPIDSVDGFENRLFLIHQTARKLSVWDLDTSKVEKTIQFSDPGSSVLFSEDDEVLGLIPNLTGDVDVFDIETLDRFDTDLSAKTVFLSPNFFDIPPTSAPELISVSTDPDKALTESWQLIYEGFVPGVVDIEGTISGNQLIGMDIDFLKTAVSPGDLVIVDNEEIEVKSVDSSTTLTLAKTPTVSGAVTFDVRANGTYVLIGSLSGTQKNRVLSDQTYESDDGSISLFIRTSFTDPESRGDFFAFDTLDTIDPIFTGAETQAVGGFTMKRPVDGRPISYIIQKGTGHISIIDLLGYDTYQTL